MSCISIGCTICFLNIFDNSYYVSGVIQRKLYMKLLNDIDGSERYTHGSYAQYFFQMKSHLLFHVSDCTHAKRTLHHQIFVVKSLSCHDWWLGMGRGFTGRENEHAIKLATREVVICI